MNSSYEKTSFCKKKYTYDYEKILEEVSCRLEEYCKKLSRENFKNHNEMGKIYCTIGLPTRKRNSRIISNFLSNFFNSRSLETVQYASILPRKRLGKFSINYLTFYTAPDCKDDLLTALELLLTQRAMGFLPFIQEEDGILYTGNSKNGEVWFRISQLHRKSFEGRKFEFFPKRRFDIFLYYVYVVDILDKMYRKELYENTNLVLSKATSNGLVLERTTEEGKNIRVNSADELLPLLQSGAFGFFLENNKCFLEQSNCRACNQSCWPNVVVDIKPGLRVSQQNVLAVLNTIHKNFAEDGIEFITKFNGNRGFHVTAYFDGLKLPEDNYIPLRLLKNETIYKQISRKQLRQLVEKLSKDPFEVVRDFIRCKTEQWKIYGKLDFLVSDLSAFDNIEEVKINASSVKRRGYHEAYYSLTEGATICLPVCRNGGKLNESALERTREISRHPFEILKYEKELLDVDIKYNDSSYVKDFLEENESKIFEKQYKKFAINLRLLQNS
jgi:hypothetical protein